MSFASSRSPLAGAWAGPALDLAVEDAGVLDYAAAPTVRFGLRVTTDWPGPIRSVLLETQIRISAARRSYDAAARERLYELFGDASQWSRSPQSLLWTRATLVVPPFTESTRVDLLVECTYDLEVASAKYLSALEEGEVPLEFLFSGTVFYTGEGGTLQTARIGLDKEAEHRMPVELWREAMDRHFPQAAWLRLGRPSFDRLHAYRARNALPSWESAIDTLLRRDEESG